MNTNNNKLFESKSDLIATLMKYRSSIFSEVQINKSLMMHLINFFIEHEESSIQKLVDTETSITQKKLKKTEFLNKTHSLMLKNFSLHTLKITSEESIGVGSYSNVYSSDNNDEVIKIMKIKDSDKIQLSLTDNTVHEFWQYIRDMFTYILWMSIFRRLSENSNNVDSIKLMENMCEIKRPFIIINRSNRNARFCVGYIIKRYDITLCDLYYQQKITINIFTEIITMLHRLYSLNNYGIVLLHRDVVSSNIMISKYFDKQLNKPSSRIHLIDFGFGLTSLKFADNTEWRFGYFFDELYDVVVDSHYDVIFFCLFMYVYHTSLLIKFGAYYSFRDLIAIDTNIKLIDHVNSSSLWLYPYKAEQINRTNFMQKFIDICRNKSN